MWRAWGIALLILCPQDALGPRASAPEHDCSFQPPAGWVRRLGLGHTFVRFIQPGESPKPAEYSITHLHSSNPTPIETFRRQAREFVKEKFAAAKVLEERDFVLAGRPAYRLIFSHEKGLELKTVVHRNNLEFYLLDASLPLEKSEAARALIESSIQTLEIVREAPTPEEGAAELRTRKVFQGAKIDPGFLGDRWFAVHVGKKKIGHMHARLIESEGLYSYEVSLSTDYGEGSSESSISRGSFSPDLRIQKIETEQTKTNAKEKWVFKSSVAIQDGKGKAVRDLNGVKEDRSFAIEDGVLLTDVAEIVRSRLVAAGKGSYLIKTMSPYSEDWNPELVEVGGLESLDVDGRDRDCVLVQAYQGRRKNLTFFYGTDHALLRVGGPRDVLSVRASTQEDALK